jgi:hypothetical protein
MKARVSRRHMLATIPAAAAAMTPGAAGALAGLPTAPADASADDPVFAAIEQHREALQALAALHEPPDALLTQLSRAGVHAFLAWLTTPPTTLVGVLVTLNYAARRARARG